MLLGEHLRRSHQHRLTARADRLQHRRQRDHGFSGADLALQQALHRIVASHIGADVVDDLPLPSGQRERQ